MGPVGVIVAAVVGAVAGLAAGPAADAIATPRYGPGTAGHDPEDLELALLTPPTSRRARIVAGAVTAGAFALLAAEFEDLEVWAYFAALVLAYVVASLIDLQYLRLPDVITWPAAALGTAGAVGLAAHFHHVEAATWAAVATLGAAGFLWLFSLVFSLLRGAEALGRGDMKLLLSLGPSVGWLGWTAEQPALGPVAIVIWSTMAGFVIGSVAGLPAAGFKVTKHVPFGPFLIIGWFVVVLLADSLRA